MRDVSFVEAMGLEPTTYGLQSRRSSQLSYAPFDVDAGVVVDLA